MTRLARLHATLPDTARTFACMQPGLWPYRRPARDRGPKNSPRQHELPRGTLHWPDVRQAHPTCNLASDATADVPATTSPPCKFPPIPNAALLARTRHTFVRACPQHELRFKSAAAWPRLRIATASPRRLAEQRTMSTPPFRAPARQSAATQTWRHSPTADWRRRGDGGFSVFERPPP